MNIFVVIAKNSMIIKFTNQAFYNNLAQRFP